MTLDSNWTNERVEILTKRWDQGISAREIGDELGITRSAVLGKKDRLKLAPRKTVSSQPRARRRQKLTRAMFNFAGGNQGLNRAQRMQKKRAERIGWEKFQVPEPTVITEEYKCSHGDLENNSCRYPLWNDEVPFGDKFFCGIPEADMRDGVAWCRHHRLVVYRPTSEVNIRAAE